MGNQCPVQLKPMATWIREEDPQGLCRECLLAPVIQWYRDELSSKGYNTFAGELDELEKKAELLPLQLCEEFDKIKGEVEESLRERLEEFDCATQAYKPEDDS